MTTYEEYLLLSEQEKNNFIKDKTDSNEKAQQLYESLLFECRRLRKVEYDQLNQFELMFDDHQNNTSEWDTAINTIKSKYPKPIYPIF